MIITRNKKIDEELEKQLKITTELYEDCTTEQLIFSIADLTKSFFSEQDKTTELRKEIADLKSHIRKMKTTQM